MQKVPSKHVMYHFGYDSGYEQVEELPTVQVIAYRAKCESIAERNAERGNERAKAEYMGRADGARDVLRMRGVR
jgi:hypothetical protein